MVRISPNCCSLCCGQDYLRVIERAADAVHPADSLAYLARELRSIDQARQVRSARNLAASFERLAEQAEEPPALASGAP